MVALSAVVFVVSTSIMESSLIRVFVMNLAYLQHRTIETRKSKFSARNLEYSRVIRLHDIHEAKMV